MLSDRPQTTLLFADEQKIVREGLRHVVQDRRDLTVVGEAAQQEGALRGILDLAPDIVVCELQTPAFDGLELIRQIRSRRLPTRFVVFSCLDHPSRATAAMIAGASGYLLKTAATAEVLAAIDTARAGGLYLSPEIGPSALLPGRSAGDPVQTGLSRRQRQILRLVAEGYSTREIGEQLGLGDRTVESHRLALMKKLNLHRVAHLVRYAIRENLIAA